MLGVVSFVLVICWSGLVVSHRGNNEGSELDLGACSTQSINVSKRSPSSFIEGHLHSNSSASNFIVEGELADISDFPFAVALAAATESTLSPFCTGSLITPGLVLTAAHCVFDFTHRTPLKVNFQLEDLRVLIHLTDIENALLQPENNLDHIFGVQKILTPENFDSEVRGFTNARYPFDDDVAMLVLDRCVPNVEVGSALRLATPEGDSEQECSLVTTVGWGQFEDHGRASSVLSAFGGVKQSMVLRKLEKQTLHKRKVCEEAHNLAVKWKEENKNKALEESLKKYGVDSDMALPTHERDHLLRSFDGDRMLCSGGSLRGATCQGDSGGPIFNPSPGDGGSSVQVATVSFGIGFCSHFPDANARVSRYAKWIESELAQDSCTLEQDRPKLFEKYPIPPFIRSDFDKLTRPCNENQWQCTYSGECVAAEGRCSRQAPLCKDGTDNLVFCHETPDPAGVDTKCKGKVADALIQVNNECKQQRDSVLRAASAYTKEYVSSGGTDNNIKPNNDVVMECKKLLACKIAHTMQQGEQAGLGQEFIQTMANCAPFVFKTYALNEHIRGMCESEIVRQDVWESKDAHHKMFVEKLMQCGK